MPVVGFRENMDAPTVNINLANATEVAQETLRRLALRRVPPTPENYQSLYAEIVGSPASPSSAATTPVKVLSGLVLDLNLHHPQLTEQVATLDHAIRKNDWALCRKQLGLISRQLKQTEGEAQPPAENLMLLRELLAKTLEFGVVSQLAHNPRLAAKAQALATAVREARNAVTLSHVASELKSLWVSIEFQAGDIHDQPEMLKRILLLLVENIGELLDDDTWLRGQLDLVQKVIAGPFKIHALHEVETRLKEVIYKQSMVKHGLREATATLKATMTTFVSRMGEVVTANDEYQGRIASHIERISHTEDVLELNHILEILLEETRSAQSDTRRVHDQLLHDRDAALHAEGRIKQLETQLAEMSTLVREDPLTHSLNRRGLDEEFAREASRADRYNTAFSIAILDVDNFKALNDQRGHQIGDEALIHLVNVAREELRLTDHVVRMGGEEFLIMLPNTGRDEAVQVITRLQRSLTKKYFLNNNERVLITFSAGVAERVPGESQLAVIERADHAMFTAKHNGKNRVCTATGRLEEASE
jgi:diguanylate cyclase